MKGRQTSSRWLKRDSRIVMGTVSGEIAIESGPGQYRGVRLGVAVAMSPMRAITRWRTEKQRRYPSFVARGERRDITQNASLWGSAVAACISLLEEESEIDAMIQMANTNREGCGLLVVAPVI